MRNRENPADKPNSSVLVLDVVSFDGPPGDHEVWERRRDRRYVVTQVYVYGRTGETWAHCVPIDEGGDYDHNDWWASPVEKIKVVDHRG